MTATMTMESTPAKEKETERLRRLAEQKYEFRSQLANDAAYDWREAESQFQMATLAGQLGRALQHLTEAGPYARAQALDVVEPLQQHVEQLVLDAESAGYGELSAEFQSLKDSLQRVTLNLSHSSEAPRPKFLQKITRKWIS